MLLFTLSKRSLEIEMNEGRLLSFPLSQKSIVVIRYCSWNSWNKWERIFTWAVYDAFDPLLKLYDLKSMRINDSDF